MSSDVYQPPLRQTGWLSPVCQSDLEVPQYLHLVVLNYLWRFIPSSPFLLQMFWYTILATWLWCSMYAFPASIFDSAVICCTISRAFLHCLHLWSCMMWQTRTSIDLVCRACSCAIYLSAQPFPATGMISWCQVHAMQGLVFPWQPIWLLHLLFYICKHECINSYIQQKTNNGKCLTKSHIKKIVIWNYFTSQSPSKPPFSIQNMVSWWLAVCNNASPYLKASTPSSLLCDYYIRLDPAICRDTNQAWPQIMTIGE